MKNFIISACYVLVFGIFVAPTSVEACPDVTAWGETYEYSARELRNGRQYNVRAGGQFFIRDCRGLRNSIRGESGNGKITINPDFTFKLSNLNNHVLQFSVVSECDSVLLINTGTETWYYDDDDNQDSRLDARITLTRPVSGIFDVWVGTHDGAVCNARLIVQTARK